DSGELADAINVVAGVVVANGGSAAEQLDGFLVRFLELYVGALESVERVVEFGGACPDLKLEFELSPLAGEALTAAFNASLERAGEAIEVDWLREKIGGAGAH